MGINLEENFEIIYYMGQQNESNFNKNWNNHLYDESYSIYSQFKEYTISRENADDSYIGKYSKFMIYFIIYAIYIRGDE